jgi:hypothetical protein
MGRPYKCPYCGATGSVSKGVRKTKTMGERRLRLCKACGRKFTPRNQKQCEDESVEEIRDMPVQEPQEPRPAPEQELPSEQADAGSEQSSGTPEEGWTS